VPASLSCAGARVTRQSLGLPDSWNTVENWFKKPFFFGQPLSTNAARKATDPRWAHITDFSKPAPTSFWKNFPSRPLPKGPTTKVDIAELKKELNRVQHLLTVHEIEHGKTTLTNLREGAPAHQIRQLRGGNFSNAPSVNNAGPEFTEVLATWLEKEVVAGPFKSPPLSEFRSNSLMAIEQKDKIRPVLNMSYPKKKSFNDNIDQDAVKSVTMSSARQFGQSLLHAGAGARMSKHDMRDAYKNVPAKKEDWRLQGFSWMGAFFVETQQIFGASTAVANFDNLAETVMSIVLARSSVPRCYVHRTLDDAAYVAPADTDWCERFSAQYKQTCAALNITLAEDCPKAEKAFTNKTNGTVLGIQFDSTRLAWRFPRHKVTQILTEIHVVIHGGHVDLKQFETLAGRLAHFGLMCPFMKAFKRPINDLLRAFNEDESILLPVPEELSDDLRVWAAAISHASQWMPLHLEIEHPPFSALEFISDAAGGLSQDDTCGVASLGLTSEGQYWFLARAAWPENITGGQLDEKGASFASKTTTLEAVGLLLPFLLAPDVVRGRHVILGVDNVAVVFGWTNRAIKGDTSASVLIRALHIVTAFLECRVYVQHVPRKSTPSSTLADALTRESTSTPAVWQELATENILGPPDPLWEWLTDPRTDWHLGSRLVDWLRTQGH